LLEHASKNQSLKELKETGEIPPGDLTDFKTNEQFIRLLNLEQTKQKSGFLSVAFVGVATWFRNGTATNPRPLGPSARRHQCGGRQMAFIDG